MVSHLDKIVIFDSYYQKKIIICLDKQIKEKILIWWPLYDTFMIGNIYNTIVDRQTYMYDFCRRWYAKSLTFFFFLTANI